MEMLLEVLLVLTISAAIFAVPAAVLALIGKMFGIKELTDAFKF